jgi:hypothetical protein
MGSARCGPTSGPAATRRAVDGSKHGCQTQEQPRAEARTIKIRDISASEMRAAADAGQMLVVTDRRQLVGIIVPITQQLVAHLIEANLSRVKRSVAQGEREYQSGSTKTLAEVLSATVGA